MSKVTSQYGSGVEICVSWVKASNGQIPQKSVKAGGSCYVARAMHGGEYIPGKVCEGHKFCFIPYGGKEITESDYEVLVETNALQHCGLEWKRASGSSVPKGAVVGGADKGQPLYVARSDVSGDVVVGKFFPPHGCSYMPHGGKEHKKDGAEVLCCAAKRV